MGVREDDVYKAGKRHASNRKLPTWHYMSPLLWAPVMYTSRFALQGRVKPMTQHRIFMGLTLIALSHAGYVMSQESSL